MGKNGSRRTGKFRCFLRSHCHTWSAHLAEFLIRNLTGFEIEEPGYAKVALDSRDGPPGLRTEGDFVDVTQIWNRSTSCGDFIVRNNWVENFHR